MSMSSSISLEDVDVSVLESFYTENDAEIVREINHFEDVESDIASVDKESTLADLEENSSNGNGNEDIEERERGEVDGLGDSFETSPDYHDMEEAYHDSPSLLLGHRA